MFVKVTERCGACGASISEGTAALEIVLHGVKRKRYRGECCAGAAPPSLPASPVLERGRDEAFFARLAALKPSTRGEFRALVQRVVTIP